jgi:hypothetical protein
MPLNPAIIALLTGSALICFITVYASVIGMQILQWWDIKSGSERQLNLERKTYLLATVLAYVMAFELLSLFLFCHTVDHMQQLYVGAMCAAGTLNVNEYGYPTLVLKCINSIVCGIWLLVNYIDNRGFDYPLIKFKYWFLLAVTALLVLEALVQFNYFTALRPDVITSCCGALFSSNEKTLVADIAHLPPDLAKIIFYLSVVLLFRTGIHFYLTGRGAATFAGFSLWLLIVSLAAILSFVSLYIYQLPTHHCPFCLLQQEYFYAGYPLYLLLFFGSVAGTGVGLINRFREVSSLKTIIPTTQKQLCLSAMICYGVFAALSSIPLLLSDFTLGAS